MPGLAGNNNSITGAGQDQQAEKMPRLGGGKTFASLGRAVTGELFCQPEETLELDRPTHGPSLRVETSASVGCQISLACAGRELS